MMKCLGSSLLVGCVGETLLNVRYLMREENERLLESKAKSLLPKQSVKFKCQISAPKILRKLLRSA